MCKPDSFKITANLTATVLLLVVLGFTQYSALQAQETKAGPVTVASVSSHPSTNGTVVTIVADGPLNRAQTWQDREGYHVVVPSAGTKNVIKVGSGIRLRQLDRTLEIVIQTKPGANVTVQPMANRLNLNVEGKLDPHASEADNINGRSDQAQRPDEGLSNNQDGTKARAGRGSADGLDGASLNSSSSEPANPVRPTGVQRQIETATGESSVMSDATVLVVIGIVCVGGLLILRYRRSSQPAPLVLADEDGFEEYNDFVDLQEMSLDTPDRAKGAQNSLMKSNGTGSNGSSTQRKSAGRLPVTTPSALYGAYQIDLEIGQLVHGQSHRMDVDASRAPDDRRAIEASLLKSISAPTGDEEMQRRARVALEEYGFVARQSAVLLSATNPYERTSAARMLGDVKSAAALPFLLEALYDSEPLVRNQAVLSIGELRLPSAIGALLDIARKHPDVPGSLLSRALSACSLDSLDFFDSPFAEPRFMSGVDVRLLAEEIMKLEPAAAAEELPESAEDEKFTNALANVQSDFVSERSEAIKVLAQFSTKSSVAALATTARVDTESSLRAAAISSLAFINHESVFPAILIAMADESRGVRAAAARSLSRLSFDRADAYIRVAKADDLESLRDVAEACIKAGIATQGIDRLTNGDHQAYEAMAVVWLLVRANTFEPLFNVIATHPNMDVRLAIIHLLGLTEKRSLIETLRSVNDGLPEEIEDALVETIAVLEASQDEADGEDECKLQASAYPDEEPQAENELESGTVWASESSHSEREQLQYDNEFQAAPEGELQARTESKILSDYGFEFAPSLESELEDEMSGEPQPPKLESSGLPAPPIA